MALIDINPEEYEGSGIVLAGDDDVVRIFSGLERDVLSYDQYEAPNFDFDFVTGKDVLRSIILIRSIGKERLSKILVPSISRRAFGSLVEGKDTKEYNASRILGRRWYSAKVYFSAVYRNASEGKCGQDCKYSRRCRVPGCVCYNGTCI